LRRLVLTHNHMKIKKIYAITIILLVVVVIGGGYLWANLKEKIIIEDDMKMMEYKAITEDENARTGDDKEAKKYQFEKSLKDKDYEQISNSLADMVRYVYDFTSYWGDENKEQALQRIKTLIKEEDAESIVFDSGNIQIKKIAPNYSDVESIGILQKKAKFLMYGLDEEWKVNLLLISPLR